MTGDKWTETAVVHDESEVKIYQNQIGDFRFVFPDGSYTDIKFTKIINSAIQAKRAADEKESDETKKAKQIIFRSFKLVDEAYSLAGKLTVQFEEAAISNNGKVDPVLPDRLARLLLKAVQRWQRRVIRTGKLKEKLFTKASEARKNA